MPTLARKTPRPWARRRKAQGIVEFSFVAMIMFMLTLGGVEMGRMLFIFSQITSAAQEAARYGATRPLEISASPDPGGSYPTQAFNQTYPQCNMITHGRHRVSLVDGSQVQIFVSYEAGDGTAVSPIPAGSYNPSNPPSFHPMEYRVVVTAQYQFHFLTGLIDKYVPNGMTLQMISARTITADEPAVTSQCAE